MDEKEKKIKAVQKVLGDPVMCEFDAKTQKIRTTLFLVSVISIVYVLGGLKIESGTSFLGLKFSGLNDELFHYTLLGATIYLTIHFLWSAIDSFLEWRLRITGTKVAFVTTGTLASDDADYPNDPRQTTLYNWWKSRSKMFSGIEENFNRVNENFETINSELEKITIKRESQDINNIISGLSSIRGEIADLRSKVDKIQSTVDSPRILVSLDRFNSWFKLFLVSQNGRWLIIEFLLPTVLSGSAIFLLLCKP